MGKRVTLPFQGGSFTVGSSGPSSVPTAAAYGWNNERALPEIAAIIESRYERSIRAVKNCRGEHRERERGYESRECT